MNQPDSCIPMDDTDVSVESPCVDNCKLDENSICAGCSLSSDEVNAWNKASNQERLAFLKNAYLRQKVKYEADHK